MSWTNYHTHCYLCDGHEEPKDYVTKALQHGMLALGFSSHAPVSFSTYWTMQADDLPTYCQLIADLRTAHASDLPIYLGLEIDYIPDITSPKAPLFQDLGLDFTVGSVHFASRDEFDSTWTVDGSPDEFAMGLEKTYGGDIRALVERYYALVRKMVQTACPTIIGHIDLVKKNNPQEKYFSESADWYQAAVFETLEVVAESEAIVEINTGGISRKRTDSLYPSPWILERCFSLDIPIHINADAHEPWQLTAEFGNAARMARSVGYETLQVMVDGSWLPRPYSETGLH